MEAACSLQTSDDFQWNTQHYAQKMKLFITTAVRTSNPISVIHVARE
jgi:hypothetical protein